MTAYLYVLGPNPYENAHSDYNTKGNGQWFTTTATVEEALKIILGSLPFPGEPAGRKFFLPGVSLPGICDQEVIQVWSTDPEIAERTRRLLGEYKEGGLHDGHGHDFGLHLEIKVTNIDRYASPERPLLAAPAATPSPDQTISPMGATLLKFQEMKYDLQQTVMQEKFEITRKEWEMETLASAMKDKVRNLNEQIGVLNTYLHGTKQFTRINTGKSGTGRYRVFQNRQFLSEEIALLGNFESFDFKQLEDLERWLMQSGRIWKFLPFERCILATRIRKDRKDYGDPLANIFNNEANMQNIIWIRDGENVCHVDTEFDFHNAVFPDRNQFDRALQACLDHVWRTAFKWSKPKDWMGHPLEPGKYDTPGQLRRKPLEVEEPYCTRRTVKSQIHTLEDWLKSEFYTELLDKQIRQAVMDHLQEVNKRQMIFAVLLQGIVDNTTLLAVPRGTDLFTWENVDRYFELIFDYTHALTWDGASNRIAPYLNSKVQVGEWIVAQVDEYLPAKGHGDGKTYREHHPMLFKVVNLEDVVVQRMDTESAGIKESCVSKPVVKYHPRSSRRHPDDAWGTRRRTKLPIRLVLKSSNYLRVPMPPSLAEQILDDRAWKSTNKWAVPFMVNYPKIIAAVKAGISGIEIEWDNHE